MKFFTSGTNSRGKISSIGGGSKGQSIHTRTWTHGVEIDAIDFPTGPEFSIYATGGSNNPSERFLIGEVVLDKKGIVKFRKAKKWRS